MVTADPANSNDAVIAGKTFTPGQQTTINNVPISVGSGGEVVAGSSTIRGLAASDPSLSAPASNNADPTSSPSQPSGPGSGGYVGGQPVVISSGHVVVGSSTLSVGQQTTIDGTVVSAGSTEVVLGSSTIPIDSTDPTSGSAVAQFTGAALRLKSMRFGVSASFVAPWFVFTVLW